MEAFDTHRVAETVFRIERARLIAGLNRMVRDIGFAEELAQEALVTALSEWPRTGVPQSPAAWLMATAKRRAIDAFRRRRMQALKHVEIGHDLSLERDTTIEEVEAAMDDDIGDERLSLIFTACHPLLSVDARVALTLRLIGGLTTDEIARTFLAGEATIAQRIVRAKKTLGSSGLAYEVPRGEDRDRRLAAVLEVIYLIFNEGYAASAGDNAIRPQLCAEAMRLCRILSGLLPQEPEVHGLLALLELHASRFPARTGADGAPVTITEQNRGRWDRLLIQHGLTALGRAERLGGADGPYALQAAIAARHARAPRTEDTDWRQIATLYDRLSRVMPSPVVDLNRAIAHSMAFGPETGLELLEPLEAEPALQGYAGMPAARGDFLMRAGRTAEAKEAFEQAARLAGNAAERQFLTARAAACGGD
ncbi:RNA polymerase ECF family sigma subunit [Ciceribacter lividus]|uniref:RNA polymerase ECF family sigma subunit n=1 Tax=Ciceribacter lividus TaxID=1197950 RepID=A0A6I7HSL1_9HYPH|nr:RNA polymerase sigma factor [Ciceribacter lividus]RCW27939.1 RNA polymerase ECF family sigma subunit [Ciceribacter lividus]